MRGDPVPFQDSALTPNLAGAPDTTDDMRGGMGIEGMAHIAKFLDDGRAFHHHHRQRVDSDRLRFDRRRDHSGFAGLCVRAAPWSTGVFADKKSPIAYGYGDNLGVYFNQSPLFTVAAAGGFGGRGGGGRWRWWCRSNCRCSCWRWSRRTRRWWWRRRAGPSGGPHQRLILHSLAKTGPNRPSGRGTPNDPDIPQGRPLFTPPAALPGAAGGNPEDEFGGGAAARLLNAPEARPRVVLRFADENDLFQFRHALRWQRAGRQPAVIDAPHGKGHGCCSPTIRCGRSETHGSYSCCQRDAELLASRLLAGLRPRAPSGGAIE